MGACSTPFWAMKIGLHPGCGIGAMFSSCVSSLNKDEVLLGLSGRGAAIFALGGCSSRGKLVDKCGREGFPFESIMKEV